jgi:hypothetical protein
MFRPTAAVETATNSCNLSALPRMQMIRHEFAPSVRAPAVVYFYFPGLPPNVASEHQPKNTPRDNISLATLRLART